MSQPHLWPSGDDFAHVGTTQLSAAPQLAGYIGCRPATTNYQVGWLHDGFTVFQSGQGIQTSLSACTYTEALDHADSLTKPRCFLWSRAPSADGQVRMVGQMFQTILMGGVPLAGNQSAQFQAFLEFSVLYRVKNGTLAGSGTFDLTYNNVDCYQLRLRTTAGVLTVTLVRIVAGTATTIASHQFTLVSSLFRLSTEIGIRMKIADVAGNPELQCFLGPFTLTTGLVIPDYPLFANLFPGFETISPLPGQTIGGVTNSAAVPGKIIDANAAKIAGVGLAGFGIGRERRVTLSGAAGTTDVADACRRFELLTTGGVATLVDHFERGYSSASQLVSGAFLSGQSMQQAWTYDSYSAVAFPKDADWFSSTSKLQVALGVAGQHSRVLAYQRRADDLQNQHRSAKITLDATGATPDYQQAGVFLRGTPFGGVGNVRAYFAFAYRIWLGGDQRLVYLVRMTSETGDSAPPSGTLIASKAVTAVEIPVGSEFEFDFQCYTIDTALAPDGPVVLKVKIAGVQIVLDATAAAEADGVSSDAAGTVYDFSASRIKGGDLEGLYVASDGAWRDFRFDDWTQQALHSGKTPIFNQVTVPVDDEGTPVGSLDTVVKPSAVFVERSKGDVMSHPFESGHRQTFPRQLRKRREFVVQVDAISTAGFVGLEDFFDDHRGLEVPFNFTIPAQPGVPSEVVAASFVEGTLNYQRRAPGVVVGVEFALEEVVA